MREQDTFFREIEHVQVPWKSRQLFVPVFYYDVMLLSISLLAPTKNLKALLPSKRLHPYRISPWHSLVCITAYAYRDSDLGPYNEISISIPVTIEKPTPIFAGSLLNLPEEQKSYIHHLPVTTEIAREVGVEFAGYPKFIADIVFTEEDEWIKCVLTEGDKHILTLTGRKLESHPVPRYRVHPLTFRHGRLLRSEFTISQREMGISKDSEDVKLDLGVHPITDELRSMKLGKLIAFMYCPFMQGILTPVIESFAA
jgi:hypothetical protein